MRLRLGNSAWGARRTIGTAALRKNQCVATFKQAATGGRDAKTRTKKNRTRKREKERIYNLSLQLCIVCRWLAKCGSLGMPPPPAKNGCNFISPGLFIKNMNLFMRLLVPEFEYNFVRSLSGAHARSSTPSLDNASATACRVQQAEMQFLVEHTAKRSAIKMSKRKERKLEAHLPRTVGHPGDRRYFNIFRAHPSARMPKVCR